MLIAHISDIHITGGDRKAYGIVPTAENLAHCVEHINQLIPKPDLVIVTGDITYDGQLTEAERAVTIFDKLHAPYFIIPGNHDNRSTLLSAFDTKTCPVKDNNFFNYVIEGYELRCIGMDSSIPDAAGGEITDKGIQWLEQQLAMEPRKPTIIFIHHPPAKFGVLETDEDGFIGADKFSKVISQHKNIKGILCGHIHLTAHLGWCGTVISTAPSMGLELVLDLTLSRHSQFNLDQPGYLLHYYNPDQNLVTHSVTVKDINGPYRFREYS
ncbi:MAG TPA: phosphodiesterase [Desulfobacterales bacterium]|nr:phosphodiesterase [Desulfobacterales bacterium]